MTLNDPISVRARLEHTKQLDRLAQHPEGDVHHHVPSQCARHSPDANHRRAIATGTPHRPDNCSAVGAPPADARGGAGSAPRAVVTVSAGLPNAASNTRRTNSDDDTPTPAAAATTAAFSPSDTRNFNTVDRMWPQYTDHRAMWPHKPPTEQHRTITP